MTAAFIICFMALAYRLRGWGGWLKDDAVTKGGTFARRIWWATCVALCMAIMGAEWWQSVLSGIGAFASMAWISHGEYFLVQNGRQMMAMAAIGAVRMAATTLPFGLAALPAIALNCVLTPFCYFIGTRLSAKLKVDIMWIAEPLAGAAFGLCLCIAGGVIG